jgi:5-methyltetrahydrofolate--homocysteine methyltransferase
MPLRSLVCKNCQKLSERGEEMPNTVLEQIKQAVIESESEIIPNLTERAVKEGILPLEIINMALIAGMQEVGEKFENGEYFLPHLIISANGMKQAMEILKPYLGEGVTKVKSLGTVVIGTVKGDIHEIGKTLVATMLSVNGFTVHDLGIDVSVEEFINAAEEHNADAIGLSALLTTTMTVQRDVIEALKLRGLRDKVKVIIGGAPVNQDWANRIGADGFANDAVLAVSLLKKLL